MAKSGIIFCLVALLLVTSSSCQEVEMEEEVVLNDEGMVIEDPLMEDDPAGTLMPFLALKGEITVVSSTGFAPHMMHYVVGNALRVAFFVQRHVDINLVDSNSAGSYELTISPGKRETTNFDYSGATIGNEGSTVFTIPQGTFKLPKANQVLGGARRTMNSIMFEFFALEDALESSEGLDVSTEESEEFVDELDADAPLDNTADGSELLDGDDLSGAEAAPEDEGENSDEDEGLTDMSSEQIDDSTIEEEQFNDEEGEEEAAMHQPEEPVDEDVEDANDTLQLPTEEDPPADVGEPEEGEEANEEVPEGFEGDQAEATGEAAEGEGEGEPAQEEALSEEGLEEGYPEFEEGEEGDFEEEPRDEL